MDASYTVRGTNSTDKFNFAFAAVHRDDFDAVLDPSYGSLKLVL